MDLGLKRATGIDIVPIPADLRSLTGCRGFVAQAAERLGGIDILVNNAGASAFGPFVDLPDDANAAAQGASPDVVVI